MRIGSLIVAALLLCSAGPAYSQLIEQRANLKDLPPVYLQVERVLPESLPYGLDPAEMRGNFSQRLEQAGVKLMSAAEDAMNRNRTLLVEVQAKQAAKERMLDYFVAVRLLEEVELRGATRQAITWERTFLGGSGTLDTAALKDVASSLVDEFIRDFQTANRIPAQRSRW